MDQITSLILTYFWPLLLILTMLIYKKQWLILILAITIAFGYHEWIFVIGAILSLFEATNIRINKLKD